MSKELVEAMATLTGLVQGVMDRQDSIEQSLKEKPEDKSTTDPNQPTPEEIRAYKMREGGLSYARGTGKPYKEQ